MLPSTARTVAPAAVTVVVVVRCLLDLLPTEKQMPMADPLLGPD
jgi:hypothetical protein